MVRLARSAGLLTIIVLRLGLGASPPSEIPPELAGIHASYQLKLGPFFTPPNRTSGLLAKARINGGPPLRLLLDSGAQFLVLDRKAAMRSGCVGGADLDLIGAGLRLAKVVKQVRARTVEIGDLTLHDTPLLITDQKLPDGIQGALPLSLFADFLIRLDIPAKTLDLLPYPPQPADTHGAVRAVSSNHLLFLKGTYNEAHEGFFLLDTGASYNAISWNAARRLKISPSMAPLIPVHAGTAEMDVPLLADGVQLRIGDREITAEPLVVIDLSISTRYHNLEVDGLIGYPALAGSVLIVNYRDRLVLLNAR